MSVLEQLKAKLAEIDPGYSLENLSVMQWKCTAVINGKTLTISDLSPERALAAMIGRAKKQNPVTS